MARSGSWEALRRIHADENGNVLIANCVTHNVRDSILQVSPKERWVLSGVRDLIIIRSGQDILICSRDQAENVRELKRLWQKKFGSGTKPIRRRVS